MRRALATTFATIVGLMLLLSYKSHGGTAHLLRPGAFAPTVPGLASTPSAQPRHAAPGPVASSAARTITGQTVDTQYGPVQVRITVAAGKITNVTPLQLPDTRGRDIEIDNYAVPQLIQETLQAQSAQIDGVSGATFTSQGYAESLQSAIDQIGR